MKRIVSGLLTVSFVLVLVSCSVNPKDLAKQSYDISMQALGSLFDLKKSAELEKKAVSIQKKVDKLSASDMRIYEEELTRLTAGILGDLFNAASNVLDNVSTEDIQNALDTAGQALDAAQQASSLLNSLGK